MIIKYFNMLFKDKTIALISINPKIFIKKVSGAPSIVPLEFDSIEIVQAFITTHQDNNNFLDGI